jgi:hypothetical protein
MPATPNEKELVSPDPFGGLGAVRATWGCVFSGSGRPTIFDSREQKGDA